MRLLLTIGLLLGLAACAMPQSQSGGGRVCIQDSGFCYFPGDPNAPADPYRR